MFGDFVKEYSRTFSISMCMGKILVYYNYPGVCFLRQALTM